MASTTPPGIRSVIAVAAGVFVGGIATVGVEALGHILVPPPPGLDVNDAEAVKAAMPTLPTAHFLPILVAYLIGPTLGAALAARMAPSRALVHAGVVGAFFLVGGIMNFRAIPHPTWFVALSIVAFIVAPFLGSRMVGKR
ncbi:MAG: hypothetical protein IPF87_17150 [Gemmatimonadetes bacterium]|nr:hypothetical protein [Gemmatimonadota bacterium]HNV75472.1 hypothetical protein [Gemmatimonadaceae bacterium]MBK6457781.1 hypothetical protein [Gemmatimonadota bacterium]MBK6843326.1 hypothetical protein [Gemmatimonadota bacterium]MBK7833577.1 hypothetical protein [Gemmatimonadota bacterium]